MKIRLIKDKEVNGKIQQKGWVLGVDEPTANKWIADGDAVRVVEEARSLKYPADAPVQVVCVAPDPAQPKLILPEADPAPPADRAPQQVNKAFLQEK